MKTRWRYVLCLVLLLLMSSTGWMQDNSSFLQSLPGRLAYIGADNNVYTLDFAAQETSQLTTDATRSVQYQWVTWSNDGRLAYFCCDLNTAEIPDTAAYVSEDGKSPGVAAFKGVGELVIYAYWSPGGCSGSSCRNLAMLVNNIFEGSMRMDMVHDEAGELSVSTVAEGSPFYYSWSSDGTQMIFHRNNRFLDIYNVMDGTITESIERASSGTFQSPQWSPVDDRVLSGIRGDEPGKTSLAVTTSDNLATPVENIGGFVSFAWSPDGRYIAYRLIRENDFGSLFVVDATSGEVVSRSLTSGVLAFFWSPDSRKIAYVTQAATGEFNASGEARRMPVQYVQNEGALTLQWSTMDIETGLNRSHITFSPAEDEIYLLLYFDQFAQSHRIWSPDSSAIVYTERGASGSDVIHVLDVRQASSVPVKVADGTFAVWSFK